jgi:hypothetical protein
MEIAIGEPGVMCHECEDAGCSGDRECLASGAYGGEDELELCPDCLTRWQVAGQDGLCEQCWAEAALTGTLRAEPPPEPLTAALLSERCERYGFYVVSETAVPALILERLLAALRALAPEPVALPSVDAWRDAVPASARGDEAHPYWAAPATTDALGALFAALGRYAPPGFGFTAEGSWCRLGFFRV